jgi:hypothetical protein
MVMPISADAPKAGRREWIGLGVIALPCLLYSMDLTVLNLAVPSLSADLAPSSAQLLWIVDIYAAGWRMPSDTGFPRRRQRPHGIRSAEPWRLPRGCPIGSVRSCSALPGRRSRRRWN